MSARLLAAIAGSAALLASCAAPAPPPVAPPPAASAPAAAAPPPARPAIRRLAATDPALGLVPQPDAQVLRAFRRACPQLQRRADPSGLTRAADWQAACADPDSDAPRFFQRHFTAVRLGDGRGLTTGYYEPELAASRTPTAGALPILGRPASLVDIDLADWRLTGGRIAGLLQNGRLRPAPARAAIEAGALTDAPALAWTTDRIGYFFLQIQGSGVLRFADGSRLRVGFAGSNGQPYVAIGGLLKQRLGLAKADMFTIRNWLRANPQAGIALMQENPRFIFLRALPATIDGPVGALGVPLLAGANIAADTRFLPFGTPVAIAANADGKPLRAFAIIADSGSAITGANRFDLFLGSGAAAEQMAGRLAARADIIAFLPNAAAARLGQ